MKQTDTQSWYRAMVRTSWSWKLSEEKVSTWYSRLAMNQNAPSKCDQMFAIYYISPLLWSAERKPMTMRTELPVSLCIVRMLHIEVAYENEARLSGVVWLDREKDKLIGGEAGPTGNPSK